MREARIKEHEEGGTKGSGDFAPSPARLLRDNKEEKRKRIIPGMSVPWLARLLSLMTLSCFPLPHLCVFLLASCFLLLVSSPPYRFILFRFSNMLLAASTTLELAS